MSQVIKYAVNHSKALELKLTFNGNRYLIYLGGLPFNIKTGYANEYTGVCDDETCVEHRVQQTEFCSSYMDAQRLFEQMERQWM